MCTTITRFSLRLKEYISNFGIHFLSKYSIILKSTVNFYRINHSTPGPLLHVLQRNHGSFLYTTNHGIPTTAHLSEVPTASPVWIEAVKRQNCMKYKKVQRLINIKIAKAYITTSNEALCVATDLTPIIIKINEIATGYKTIKT
jgi:mRNA degradation ribonuclease J1/J2